MVLALEIDASRHVNGMPNAKCTGQVGSFIVGHSDGLLLVPTMTRRQLLWSWAQPYYSQGSINVTVWE